MQIDDEPRQLSDPPISALAGIQFETIGRPQHWRFTIDSAVEPLISAKLALLIQYPATFALGTISKAISFFAELALWILPEALAHDPLALPSL